MISRGWSALGVTLVLGLVASAAMAAPIAPVEVQEAPASTPRAGAEGQPQEPGAVDSASVRFGGSMLFAVRGIPGFPARERARTIADRMRAMARDRTFDLADVRTEEMELGTAIMAGDDLLVLLTGNDVQLVGAPNSSALADLYTIRIREAAQRYRADREVGVLWLRALYALGETLVLILALLALRWLRHKSLALERRYAARIGGVRIKSVQLISANQILAVLHGLLRGAFALVALFLVALFLVYSYLNGVLRLFPWTKGIADNLLQYVLDPLRVIALGFVRYLPNLVFLVILVFVARLLLKGLKIFWDAVERGAVQLTRFDPDWALPTYRLLRILVVAILVVVAYPYIPGSGSAAFKGVSVFLGVIFSLGSSSVVGNVIAGYSMVYRRTFKVGDRVRIGDQVGDVLEIRLLVTHLRSPKNEEIVVPNSLIIGSNVVNYSSIARRHGLILHTTVGIGYEVPWRQVEAMLTEAAGRTEGLLSEPPPFVLQRALADFCVTYELNAYCEDPEQMYPLYSELHRNIQDVFNEHGVQIMTPAYVTDPEEPKVVPPNRWYESPARTAAADNPTQEAVPTGSAKSPGGQPPR
jgi:small-conductance mechanosensitive channel